MIYFQQFRYLLLVCGTWVLSALFTNVFGTQTIEAYIPDDTPNSRYTVHGDGTVTDTGTQLMWKQCSEGQTNNDSCTGIANTMSWKSALEIASNSTFAGHRDWRVPNIKELRSIVSDNRIAPSINETIFPNTPNEWYWSSSPSSHSSHKYVWMVYFQGGYSGFRDRDGNNRIRLVRGGR